MRKYQNLLHLFLRFTPPTNHSATTINFDKAGFNNLTQKQIDPLYRYMQSLQTHREYLEFFQIGVIRDQRSKIEKVAKYVGLAMPQILPHLFRSQPIDKSDQKSQEVEPNHNQKKQ